MRKYLDSSFPENEYFRISDLHLYIIYCFHCFHCFHCFYLELMGVKKSVLPFFLEI